MKTLSLLLVVLITISSQAICQEKWTNRIGNQTCQPYRYSEPNTVEELSQHIKQAALEGHRVRAVGNGYSISDIACTDGHLVSLKHLKRILSIDSERKLVRVEAGILIHDLNVQLATSGLALSNQAAISQISLGGALSTGVHGSGHTGTLASFITEIELITADGSLRKLSNMSDPDAFAAATVSMGSLGIIYAVTLQCEPLFYLNSNSETSDIDTMIKQYKNLNNTNEFFQFSWNVETGKVIINRWNRCEQKRSPNNIPTESVPSYKALSYYLIDETDKDLFSEIAVPIDLLPEALKTIKELVKKFKTAGAEITDINIRFVEQDKGSLLSPASNGPAATIALCILEDRFFPFYKEFEEAMYAHHGRPHWGKINFLDYKKANDLYGINLQKFINIKHRLDPKGVFSNSFTNRLLEINHE